MYIQIGETRLIFSFRLIQLNEWQRIQLNLTLYARFEKRSYIDETPRTKCTLTTTQDLQLIRISTKPIKSTWNLATKARFYLRFLQDYEIKSNAQYHLVEWMEFTICHRHVNRLPYSTENGHFCFKFTLDSVCIFGLTLSFRHDKQNDAIFILKLLSLHWPLCNLVFRRIWIVSTWIKCRK